MNNRRVILVAAAALVAGILACGGALAEPTATPVPPTSTPFPTVTPAPTVTPVPTDPPADAGGSTSGVGSIEVINETNFNLCFLYVTQDYSTGWGPDQLEDDIIAPGETFTLTNIPIGTYDVMITDCNDARVNALFDAQVDGDKIWTIAEATLEVINESSLSICEFNVEPTSADTWGANQLGGTTLEPGEIVSYTLAEVLWDLRAIPCDTSISPVTEFGLDMDGDKPWTLSDQ
ncbi:MAG: hypothetical protein ACFB51_00290 [Anaerolineae bacterium]